MSKGHIHLAETCQLERSPIPVFAIVLVREVTLECIGHPFAVWMKVVTPDIGLARKSSASRELPFRFRGQPIAGQFA